MSTNNSPRYCLTCGAAGADICESCEIRAEWLAAELGAQDPTLTCDGTSPLAAAIQGALRAHVPPAAFAETGTSVATLADWLAGAACRHLSVQLGFIPGTDELSHVLAGTRRS